MTDPTRADDAGTPEPSRIEGGGGDRLRAAYPRRLPLHLDPERARSCPRRERHEPHEPHPWLHQSELSQRVVFCHGVLQVPADVKLCYIPSGRPHPPHGWTELDPDQPAPVPVTWQCPGIPPGAAERLLAASFREVPEAERVTASHAWQAAGNVLDDLAAYRDAGYPGLSGSRSPEVDPEPNIVARIGAVLAQRPLVLVHDQAAADALAGASAELPGLGIALVFDEAIPAGTALVVDRAKLTETLGRWAAEQVTELRPQLPLRLQAYPPVTVAEPGAIGWAALITGL